MRKLSNPRQRLPLSNASANTLCRQSRIRPGWRRLPDVLSIPSISVREEGRGVRDKLLRYCCCRKNWLHFLSVFTAPNLFVARRAALALMLCPLQTGSYKPYDWDEDTNFALDTATVTPFRLDRCLFTRPGKIIARTTITRVIRPVTYYFSFMNEPTYSYYGLE